MKRTEYTFSLEADSIGEIIGKISEFLEENKTDHTICQKMCGATEDLLMNLQKRSEGSNPIQLKLMLGKRTGNLVIAMDYPGKRFDPMDKEYMEKYSDALQESFMIKPVWTRLFGQNRITVNIPTADNKTEMVFVSAVVFAVIVGLLGGIIPDNIRSFLVSYVFNPVADIFVKLPSIVAPMLIFLGLILTMVRNKGTASMKLRQYIIRRYILISILLTAISAAALIPFFRFQLGGGGGSLATTADSLYKMLLDTVPSNLIMPFANNSIPQILILAVLFAAVMRIMDDRAERLTTTIDDLYTVFLQAVNYICKFLPLFIFTSLISILWSDDGSDSVLQLWKPTLALIAVYLFMILLYVVYVAVRYRVSVWVLLKKIMPSTLIGLTTASSTAAFSKINEVNEALGIEKNCSDFTVPIGVQLYCGAGSAVFIAIAYFLAESFGVSVNPNWFINAAIISLIVSLSSPPVSGGTTICLNVMMATLTLPQEGLAIASALALVFDFISTGSYIAMRHMEMVIQAGHLEMLDTDVLRASKR